MRRSLIALVFAAIAISPATGKGRSSATGIDLKTLKRWMRLPEFIEEWRRAKSWTRPTPVSSRILRLQRRFS
jgi:hypothetical protein